MTRAPSSRDGLRKGSGMQVMKRGGLKNVSLTSKTKDYEALVNFDYFEKESLVLRDERTEINNKLKIRGALAENKNLCVNKIFH